MPAEPCGCEKLLEYGAPCITARTSRRRDQFFHDPHPTAPAALAAEVSVDEASRLRDAGAFMLDVREPDEWAAGHIEGATLIPLGALAARAKEVPADRQVVVVCRSGNRSAQGRDVLLGAGLPSVTSMAGGMNDWAASGKPVVTGS